MPILRGFTVNKKLGNSCSKISKREFSIANILHPVYPAHTPAQSQPVKKNKEKMTKYLLKNRSSQRDFYTGRAIDSGAPLLLAIEQCKGILIMYDLSKHCIKT